MNKYLVWAIVVFYWLSPIDLMPGNPLDDIVIMALAWNREQVAVWLKGVLQNGQ